MACTPVQLYNYCSIPKPTLPSISIPISKYNTNMPSPPCSPSSLPTQHLPQHCMHPDFIARYALGQELGSGGFGFVMSAYERSTGIERAVKFIFREKVPDSAWVRDPILGAIPMEIYVLKNVRHPNMIEYIDCFQDKFFFYLVMELHGSEWTNEPTAPTSNLPSNIMITPPATPPVTFSHSPTLSNMSDTGIYPYSAYPMGQRTSCDLFECIEQHRHFDEFLAKSIFRQIVDCIAHLDSLGLCHRDIKDENIVIDRNYKVKMIDFGSAVILPRHYGENRTCLFKKFYGTVSFASPEILQSLPYRAEPAEVWSLGVLLYTILFGEVPFHDPHMTLAGRFTTPKIKVSVKCMHLVNSMLERSPEKRPTVHQILTHPWLQDL